MIEVTFSITMQFSKHQAGDAEHVLAEYEGLPRALFDAIDLYQANTGSSEESFAKISPFTVTTE